MSTYVSNRDLPESLGGFGSNWVDVAYCCLGGDVRLIVGDRGERSYFTPDEARAIAEALLDSAEEVDRLNQKRRADNDW